jgi:hypothetical protein
MKKKTEGILRSNTNIAIRDDKRRSENLKANLQTSRSPDCRQLSHMHE